MTAGGGAARLRRLLARITPRAAKPRLLRLFRNTRYRANGWIGRSPLLLFALYRHSETYRERLVTRETELVIEGAPRVASTYCVEAFVLAQRRAVRLATHTHLPANVIRAVRRGIPALVLIREPAQAARSTVLRNRDLTLRSALSRYYHFYRPLTSLRDDLVLADFEEVTSDLGAVIERINHRFGTEFTPCRADARHEAAVRRRLIRRDRLLDLDPLGSFLPGPAKEQAKSRIAIDPADPGLRACRRLYERLSPLAAAARAPGDAGAG